MKKLLLGCIFSFLLFVAAAQDIKAIKKTVDKSDWATARTQIDAFLTKNPDNPEGLWYKAKIYSTIAGNEALRNTVPDARKIAFEAFQKAIATGEKNQEFMKLMVFESQNIYKPVIDLYTGYFDEAARKFNSAVTTGNKED